MSKDVEGSLSGSEDSEGWDDADEGQDSETLAIVSLFDDKVFPDAVSMLKYCKTQYSFDFLDTRNRLQLDFYGSIKLLNFVRNATKEGRQLPKQIAESDIQDDRYLMPVLADDALIMSLDDLPASLDPGANKDKAVDESAAAQRLEADGTLASKNAALQTQLDELTRQFASYRLTVEQTLDKRWETNESETSSVSGKNDKDGRDESQYYWESYANHDIHETMLKDTVRTDAYRDFIYNNKHLFAGKIVLDIGCGTGILSMFCAKAGAKQVIAVDKSDILDKARENVFKNGLSDTITILRGRIEDVILPVDKVDVIVSEWMGYCLLFEAMLPSVIFARDKYLKPDGLMVPSHATIWMAPVFDPEYVTEHVSFWRDVYGFDMEPMQSDIYKDVRVITVPEDSLCGDASPYALDLYHATVGDLAFSINWKSILSKEVDCVDGFVLWFDNYFATKRGDKAELITVPSTAWRAERKDGSVAFTTGPQGQETHWRQGFLLAKQAPQAKPLKAGDQIEGLLSFSTPENHARGLTIKVDWNSSSAGAKSQSWALS